MHNESKQKILQSIQLANAMAGQEIVFDDPANATTVAPAEPEDERVNRFCQRLRDYGVIVHQCREDELPAKIQQCIDEKQFRKIVYPQGIIELMRSVGDETICDTNLTTDVLDSADGVVTACALAIAETGTIALDGSSDQGRRAISLVPDWHLCIVRTEQIVASVEEGIKGLEHAAKHGAPITLISGPSATADIEFHRVQGVHGPRNLEVIIYS